MKMETKTHFKGEKNKLNEFHDVRIKTKLI